MSQGWVPASGTENLSSNSGRYSSISISSSAVAVTAVAAVDPNQVLTHGTWFPIQVPIFCSRATPPLLAHGPIHFSHTKAPHAAASVLSSRFVQNAGLL